MFKKHRNFNVYSVHWYTVHKPISLNNFIQIWLLVLCLLTLQFDDSHIIQRYFIKEYTAAITGGKTDGSGKIKQIQQILQSQWISRIKGIKNKDR